MTSSGVPVGDTTLLAKLREQGVHTWERRIMGGGHPSMFSVDITDEVVTLIEAAQGLWLMSAKRTGNPTPIDVFDVLGPALAPFVGEATQ